MDLIKSLATTHAGLLQWLGWLSLATFVISLAVIPILVTKIPADYFKPNNTQFQPPKKSSIHYLITTLLRNMAALALIVAGLAMLLLPGQGLLTILIGVFISDFPGKRKIEEKLISQPNIFKTINWIRNKRGVALLTLPASAKHPDSNLEH